MPEIHTTLSKSQYVQGHRCPRALWYQWNRKDLKTVFDGATKSDMARRARMTMGDEIGQMSHDYFGGGAEVTDPYWKIGDAEKSTKAFIAGGADKIFEATAIDPADGTYARIDLLRKVSGTDEWDMIEVKSTSSVKDHHIDDLSFQYHVFTGAGYRIRSGQVMLIDNNYVRQGPVDLQRLFRFEDITDKIKSRQSGIAPLASELIRIRNGKDLPAAEIGSQCDRPFPCDYKKQCWKDVPDLSVFNVLGMKEGAKIAKEIGSYDAAFLPAHLMPTDQKKVIDVVACRTGKEHCDPAKLEAFLEKLKYPLYFLDYETIQPTVPLYDGTRPFQNIPFQFSLHVQDAPGAPLRHHEFIHRDRTDPRPSFIDHLVKACGAQGSIVVYNQKFEEGRNRELAQDFPGHAPALESLNGRMVDLIEPFRARWLYHPAQAGSASIKDVLPAFTDLKYDDLEVANGPEAMNLYTKFVRGMVDAAKDPDKFWSDMLLYCRLDTMAMAKLLDVVRDRAQGGPVPGKEDAAPCP